ncbi:hypothetical protein [Martelella alba]|uniref:Uncharacterized protein n=1 Tax=Martelella alba TaxID=2590451 RepID=A0ABY2SN92_9HYPH|nr:hypothetical protein [Martelella alba]TKI06725.1 hypothetical protein FCN80_09010 [Martelella alba]
MEWLLPLLGGLGVGSILSSALTQLMSRRSAKTDRLYQEKKEAYFGLLGALHAAAVTPSEENSKHFALWQTKCEIFGDPDVAKHVQELVDTNEGPREARNKAFSSLIQAMRADLRRV